MSILILLSKRLTNKLKVRSSTLKRKKAITLSYRLNNKYIPLHSLKNMCKMKTLFLTIYYSGYNMKITNKKGGIEDETKCRFRRSRHPNDYWYFITFFNVCFRRWNKVCRSNRYCSNLYSGC